ncbi:MAG TPA: sugar phosphate isomerase/epimerase [Clostridiales bacterium]|jgi:putative sugar phosphate isomerase/epimerase|uniref:Sugar phosphate isomerase/epimerase n=1 Tax=Congzhengia minquanensis TaxID=2763657 RepID=A0A926HZW3_9FIRM|nr:sugar phosphate isomerase/epimerase [Congzhengia minquanensis]MBC8541281.1 sugar phosphate isomerase/epimerase [Congzhengia minquanensis]MBD8945908.1 sugar phosphate isomerase/epimerase [Clostridiales bacterium]HBL82862.1 sugar phosphate isomerase/epimerase [Clostridiales bacterium]
MDKRIGAQLYSLRTFLEKPEDLDPTFAKVADIGYKTIQVSGLGPMPYSLIKEKADQHGLEIVCTHMGMDRYIHEIDGVIADHKAMDCKIAGIGAMPGEYREDLDALKKSINHFNKFSEELGKEGITFGYHNHGFEFVKLDGKFIMDYIVENTDISFIVDTYWFAFAGIDPAAYIKKLGKRAIVVHFKDLKALPNNTVTMCEVMEGNLNWDSIIKACEEAGAGYAMVEQDNAPDGDAFASMALSYKNLTTKGFI